jgi:hypothetical protein
MVIVVGLGAGALGSVGWFLTKGGIQVGAKPTVEKAVARLHKSEMFNYSYEFPPAPWNMDDDLKQAIQSNLFALRRGNPESYLALFAKDYKTYTPRDGQAFDELYNRLDKYFTNLEYEQQPEGRLASQPAMKVLFQGKIKDGTLMVGEAYVMIYQGIVYAVITWCPKEEQQQAFPEFDNLRQRFTHLSYRESWSDKRVPVIHQGAKASYNLQDNSAVWQKNPDLQDFYKADLLLEATDPSIPDAKTNTAVLMVLLQPKKNDLQQAVAAAREALEKEQRKHFPETKIEIMAGPAGPQDRDALVGDQKGHIAKLGIINAENRHRFVVLATVLGPEQTIVFHCECPWERRSLWERDFDQMIGTLRLK